MKVSIAKPFIGPEEQAAVARVLASGQLVQGPLVAEFERRFAAYHGARHGVAVTNGTAALTASLLAHDIGRGDEVIVPSFSFFATASAVLSVGARPVFCDIEPATFCLDPDAVESLITPRTRALLPVHLFGHPASLPRLAALAEARGLALIEDAAQGHGAAIGARRVGTWGTAAFSFHPTKNMTTTEGGMVLTQEEELARRLRLARNHGRDRTDYHERVGFNLRMTELCAAIGLVQLGRLPGWTEQRIANAAYYDAHLRGVGCPQVATGTTHVFHQYTVRAPVGLDRDALCSELHRRGVGVRVYYPRPIHRQPAIRALGGYEEVHLPATDAAAASVFSLPVHPALTEAEREFVVDEVNRLVGG